MYNYFFTLQVLTPKIEYKVQKLIKLVTTKTSATTKAIIGKVLVSTPKHTTPPKAKAITTRILLSATPIFFFMISILKFIFQK